MTSPTFWDVISRSSDELATMGIARSQIVEQRFAMTGHVRPIGWPWIKTFGSWGATEPVDVIADRAGVEVPQVREYAKARGLRYATRNLRRTHAELAIALWCDRPRGAAESCVRFGVYAGERRILCAAAQILIDGTKGGIETILRWRAGELHARFAELAVRLHPPANVLRGEALTEADAAAHRHEILTRITTEAPRR